MHDTPTRTFCDLAAMLTLAELVAVGDHLLRRGAVSSLRTNSTGAVAGYPGRRGTRYACVARSSCSTTRSESPKESELRVLLIEAGFRGPLVNASVCDDGDDSSHGSTCRIPISRSRSSTREITIATSLSGAQISLAGAGSKPSDGPI